MHECIVHTEIMESSAVKFPGIESVSELMTDLIEREMYDKAREIVMLGSGISAVSALGREVLKRREAKSRGHVRGV